MLDNTKPLILLAAGESKRMGKPKQLLPYRDSSLIRHAVTEGLKSNCHPVVVVLGANCDRITSELAAFPIETTYNSSWQQGMSSSIAEGINWLLNAEINFEAVVIALADQPLVTSENYNSLVKRYRSHSVKAVASEYSNTLGVPALFSRDLVPQLLNMHQQGGAKKLLIKYSDRSLNLTLPQAALDIDTPEDYQKLLQLLNKTTHYHSRFN